MRPEDVEAVHRLDVTSFSLPWPKKAFHHEVNENLNARCWVAEIMEAGTPRLAAMLVAWLILDEIHIATLAVDPAYRRRGIGACILSHCLKNARQEGAQLAYLEVRAGNLAAHALYERFGFVVEGRRKGYYVDNGEDALLMTLHHLETRDYNVT
jgi:[ribosomal protein S18]-alanine N-acetyltransferase